MELMGFHRDIGLNQCWPVRNRARFVHKASSVRKPQRFVQTLISVQSRPCDPLRTLDWGKPCWFQSHPYFVAMHEHEQIWTMSLDANFGKVSDGSGVWSGVLRSELKDSGIGKAPSVVIKPGLLGRAGPIWWRKKHFNRTCFGWNCFWASTGPMLQQFEGCWGYVGPMLCLCWPILDHLEAMFKIVSAFLELFFCAKNYEV